MTGYSHSITAASPAAPAVAPRATLDPDELAAQPCRCVPEFGVRCTPCQLDAPAPCAAPAASSPFDDRDYLAECVMDAGVL